MQNNYYIEKQISKRVTSVKSINVFWEIEIKIYAYIIVCRSNKKLKSEASFLKFEKKINTNIN